MDSTRELANKAMMGDEQAAKSLRLSDVSAVEYQNLNEISKDILDRIYTLSAKAAMGAKCLGLDLLKMSSIHVMEMTNLLASKELNCSLCYNLDKDDVIKRMSALCKDGRVVTIVRRKRRCTCSEGTEVARGDNSIRTARRWRVLGRVESQKITNP